MGDGPVHNDIGGPVTGPVIQAHTIGAVYLGGSPERVNPDITHLLRAHISNAMELPYRLPGARRPTLAAVHVRQDLGTGVDDTHSDKPRPAPILDSRGHVTEPARPPLARVAVRPRPASSATPSTATTTWS
ncbi:hypothetical protein ACFQV2_07365 [Actinokineospora soli]|uniref:Uncharacterized protein n=1 Tax=Actinokineospora soli TaxID=1048753 RepID=A0ABW2TIG0_9PSEU